MSDQARFRFRYVNLVVGLAVLVGSFAFLAGNAGAASVTLFVRKATVRSLVEGGKVYAPVTDLLRAMNFTWNPSGEGFELRPGTTGGPDFRSKHLVFTYGGKTFATEGLLRGGHLWVQVKPLAESLGGLYIETPGSGIAQVVFPSSPLTEKDLSRAVKEAERRPSIESKPPVTVGAPGEKTGEKVSDKPGDKTADAGSKDDEKEPLEAKVEFTNPAIPGAKNPAEVRGTCVLKNTSDQTVRNVKVDISFVDQSGGLVQHLDEHPKKFDEMPPGSTVQWDFMWYNYPNYMNIKEKVVINHDPLPKKKKDDGKSDKKDDKKDVGAPPAPKSK